MTKPKTAKKTAKKVAAKAAPKKSTLNLSAVPKRHKDVLARRNADKTVAVMRLDNDEFFYTLDGLAAEIWTMIDNKSSFGEIQKQVIQKFKPPVARFEKDFVALVAELRKEKLISA